VLSLLPAGEYTVTVTATGFQSLTQARVVVDALATVGLDLKLQIGAANQSITVSEAPFTGSYAPGTLPPPFLCLTRNRGL
jgi:hypothetical protein